jgi:hypothetical protein
MTRKKSTERVYRREGSRARTIMKFKFLVVSSLAIGCGSLTSRPGDDFRVEVTTPEIFAVQQVAPMDLAFSVEGCDDFVATVTFAGGAPTTLEPKALGNGRYSAALPVESLRAPNHVCREDSETVRESPATFGVTCRADGRTTIANLKVKYAPAWRASWRGRGPADAIFAGPTPDQFYEIGSGWLNTVEGKERKLEEEAATSNAPQHLVAMGQSVHVWSRCPTNDCGMFWFVDTPTRKIGAGADVIQVFDTRDGDLRFTGNITAPPDPIDFIREDSESVLLSVTSNKTAISRITGTTLRVATLLDGEVARTKFGMLDGAHVFLTQTDSNQARLRRSDGSLVGEFPLPGAGKVLTLSLAPTGDAWVVVRGGEVWLSTLSRNAIGVSAPSVTLLSEISGANGSVNVAWTTSGVVLQDSTGAELFSRATNQRTWKTVDPRRSVVFATGVGESVVLLTFTGLQIVDAAGRITGGADPIAPECGLNVYEPRHLAVLGPDVVALAGRQGTYQFRVSGVPSAVSR